MSGPCRRWTEPARFHPEHCCMGPADLHYADTSKKAKPMHEPDYTECTCEVVEEVPYNRPIARRIPAEDCQEHSPANQAASGSSRLRTRRGSAGAGE